MMKKLVRILKCEVSARRFGRQLAIGNGRNRISLTHVANLSHAVECALSAPNGYHVFNVADATESTLD